MLFHLPILRAPIRTKHANLIVVHAINLTGDKGTRRDSIDFTGAVNR